MTRLCHDQPPCRLRPWLRRHLTPCPTPSVGEDSAPTPALPEPLDEQLELRDGDDDCGAREVFVRMLEKRGRSKHTDGWVLRLT